MNRLKNKVTIITGGNSGIGKGIAECFHREGAKIVIFGRNATTLAKIKDKLRTNILTVQGDVRIKQDLVKLYKTTAEHFGNIDVLVANAGIGERYSLDEADETIFDEMVDTNYRGCYFTVKYALKYLNEGASIILISSIAASMTFKSHSVYSSTKAGVTKLAKNFAFDLSDRLIRVNSISPGYIKTNIFQQKLAQDKNYLTKQEKKIPLQRIGEPQDVANAALFLASSESSYITGIDLIVDGGYASSFET